MAAIALVCSLVLVQAETEKADQPARRESALKLKKDGNWKQAYEAFSKLAVDPADDPKQVEHDLNNAIDCLRRLGRLEEVDAFRERVIAAHGKNWRLLRAAEFTRGPHRGGRARYANSYERDRIRALQLMQQAVAAIAREKDEPAVAQFHMDLANMLLANRGYDEAWRLQYLSDLTELPDYEEGYYYYRGGGRGAPVGPHDSRRLAEVQYHFASFLHHQFGVQTMQQYRWYFARAYQEDDSKKDESGTYALHTLGEDETIARLATGIKRFKLPKEFDFIRIFKDVADGKSYAEQSLDTLARMFENRRQYPKAAEYWKQAIERFGEGRNAWRRKRLDQIVANWGMFESILTQPAGRGAGVEFRFRNGKKVSFTAHEVDVKKLLDDVKAYIKAGPARLDWDRMNIADIGYRLVVKGQSQYVGRQVASWDLELKPRPRHFDNRITVSTPLQKAGAYLLTARMEDGPNGPGNTSRIIIWVADTAIVQKPLDEQSYCFVADAVSGRPIPKANLEFFGYWQEYVRDDNRGAGHYVVRTRNFAEFTDADGQVFYEPKENDNRYQWLITATTPDGRLAYLGFTGVWTGRHYDREYNEVKYYTITDRPVYRPAQKVSFKIWANQAQYDREGPSPFAKQNFLVLIRDPKGEKVFEKSYAADEFGGFDGEFTLDKEATLGVYRVELTDRKRTVGHFRVEEYKKPEFEVTIEAPKEPV
ncbi:MAG: hypothetical protein AMJ81_10860, partial [Phycisphaerae bacterium SM23_33]